MNGFSAADMSTAAANGHRDGYQAGYADAVKAVEVGKPAAAQEAVAWQRRWADADGLWFSISKEIYEATQNGKWADRYEVRALYAAPVTAAPMFDYQDVLGSAAAAEAVRDAGELLRTLGAPGIDLKQFRVSLTYAADVLRNVGNLNDSRVAARLENLLALIDASPKDGSDTARLDSGMIRLSHRDEFGEDGYILHTGVNLRAAIDAAMQYQAGDAEVQP